MEYAVIHLKERFPELAEDPTLEIYLPENMAEAYRMRLLLSPWLNLLYLLILPIVLLILRKRRGVQ